MSDAKICDVCGEIIKQGYKYIRIENGYVNSLVPVVGTKYLDICPKCWEKFKRLLGDVVGDKEQENGNSTDNL